MMFKGPTDRYRLETDGSLGGYSPLGLVLRGIWLRPRALPSLLHTSFGNSLSLGTE